MTRNDIIGIAREAGMGGSLVDERDVYNSIIVELERFANLVASAEIEACEALHDHEDVIAPIGNSSWGEAYQEGWAQGTAAYRDAIRARGQA